MVSFYVSDFSKSELETQLEVLGQMKIPVSGHHLQFCDIYKYFFSVFTFSTAISLITSVLAC